MGPSEYALIIYSPEAFTLINRGILGYIQWAQYRFETLCIIAAVTIGFV